MCVTCFSFNFPGRLCRHTKVTRAFVFYGITSLGTASPTPKNPGHSPSMPLLVFWPLAGAWGAGEILPPCAQLLWCELYVMKDPHKKITQKAKKWLSTSGEPEETVLTSLPRFTCKACRSLLSVCVVCVCVCVCKSKHTKQH